LRLLSSQAAIAIENAQLYTNSQIMAQNLSEAYKQLQHELKERQQAEEQRAALQEEIIHAQKSILAELSTPLIPITDDIVIMPLIGSLDTQRAEQVLTALLDGTQRHHPRVVIIDITGVPVVDTGVASTLIHAAQAVRLLGAQTFISGIRPEVAQTLVGLGVELNGIITQGTLQSSIAYALQSANALGQGRANGHINGNGKGQSFYQFNHIGNKPK
jgi:anti-anti-sigma factor